MGSADKKCWEMLVVCLRFWLSRAFLCVHVVLTSYIYLRRFWHTWQNLFFINLKKFDLKLVLLANMKWLFFFMDVFTNVFFFSLSLIGWVWMVSEVSIKASQESIATNLTLSQIHMLFLCIIKFCLTYTCHPYETVVCGESSKLILMAHFCVLEEYFVN